VFGVVPLTIDAGALVLVTRHTLARDRGVVVVGNEKRGQRGNKNRQDEQAFHIDLPKRRGRSGAS
jgi:hypothetical protein